MANIAQSPTSPHNIDRIGSLPEPLLCHVLCFLTTKEAVRTSVLSKQWRYLWTRVPSLDIEADDMQRTRNASFNINLSEFLSRLECHNIRKLRFSCNSEFDHVNLVHLLRVAHAGNLRELDLSIDYEDNVKNARQEVFELPPSLLSCKTLVVLKLRGKIAVNLSSSSLPNLEVLHIDHLSYKTFFNNVRSSPALKELVVTNGSKCNPKITMRSIRVNFLVHVEYKLETHCFAKFDILLRACMKTLTIVKRGRDCDRAHRCDAYGCSRCLPEKVPNIMSIKELSTFVFRGFEGSDGEVEFVGYILKHSKALKNVTLTTCDVDAKKRDGVVEKLLALERASTRCQLNLVGNELKL